MTLLATNAGRLDARATTDAAGFRVELLRDWKQATARWHEVSPPTPFQHPQWHSAWYDAFAGAAGLAAAGAGVFTASMALPIMYFK